MPRSHARNRKRNKRAKSLRLFWQKRGQEAALRALQSTFSHAGAIPDSVLKAAPGSTQETKSIMFDEQLTSRVITANEIKIEKTEFLKPNASLETIWEVFEKQPSKYRCNSQENIIDGCLMKVEEEAFSDSGRYSTSPDPFCSIYLPTSEMGFTRNTIYCRLCLKETDEDTCLSIEDVDLNYVGEDEVFREHKREEVRELQRIVKICLPFFDSLVFNPVFCEDCLRQLKTCYKFVSQCRHNQTIIENYVDNSCSSEKIVNINEIIESDYKVPNTISKTANTMTRAPKVTYSADPQIRGAQNVAEGINVTCAKRQRTKRRYETVTRLHIPNTEINEETVIDYSIGARKSQNIFVGPRVEVESDCVGTSSDDRIRSNDDRLLLERDNVVKDQRVKDMENHVITAGRLNPTVKHIKVRSLTFLTVVPVDRGIN